MNHPGQSTLRIAFVMAEASPRPVGGEKTVYRYADELAARGHYVAKYLHGLGDTRLGKTANELRELTQLLDRSALYGAFGANTR